MTIAKRKAILAFVAYLVLMAVIFLYLLPECRAEVEPNSSGSVEARGETQPPKSIPAAKSQPKPEPGASPDTTDKAEKKDESAQVRADGENEYLSDGETPLASTGAGDSSALGGLGEVMLYLGVIVVLIVLSLFIFKKYMPGGKKIFQSKAIEVLSRAYLAPKQGVFVVKLAERILVLGVCGGSINTLADIDEPEEVARIQELTEGGGSDGISSAFKSIFGRKSGDFQTKDSVGITDGAGGADLGGIKTMISNWRKKYSGRAAGGE